MPNVRIRPVSSSATRSAPGAAARAAARAAAQPLQLPCSQVPRAHATLSASGSSRRMMDDVGVPRVHVARERERQRRRTMGDEGCYGGQKMAKAT